MDIVKKNLISIIFGVVAVGAIVLSFFPLSGFYDQLQTDLDKSKARYSKAGGLLAKSRMTPVIAPGQKQTKLTAYPTPKRVEETIEAQKGLKKEARDILAQAVADNMREFVPEGRTLNIPADLSKFDPADPAIQKTMLLTPGSLPNPSADAPFAFQKALDAEMKKLRETVLVGGMPPTQADMDKAIADLWAIRKQDLQFTEPGKPAINEAQVQAEFEKQKLDIPDRLRGQIAQKYKIYVEPTVLVVDPSIKSGTLVKEQIWYAQVALWIQTDVVRAVRETNELPIPTSPVMATTGPTTAPAVPVAAVSNVPKIARNVLESPIKRLARLDVPLAGAAYQRSTGSMGTPAMGGGAGGAVTPMSEGRGGGRGGAMATPTTPDPAIPVEAIPGANEVPKQNPAISPSGRSCNSVYDVVQFNVVVDIDARAVQLFLNQLSRGRLIAVRKVDITRPDLTEATNLGYFYGSAPVVQMNLDCEALILRDWTVPLMPSGAAQNRASIREMFGIPTPYVSLLAPPATEKKPGE